MGFLIWAFFAMAILFQLLIVGTVQELEKEMRQLRKALTKDVGDLKDE